jgi:hypothetical protein
VLVLTDLEIKASAERLSKVKLSSQSELAADPDLKLVSERSPYMRPVTGVSLRFESSNE